LEGVKKKKRPMGSNVLRTPFVRLIGSAVRGEGATSPCANKRGKGGESEALRGRRARRGTRVRAFLNRLASRV